MFELLVILLVDTGDPAQDMGGHTVLHVIADGLGVHLHAGKQAVILLYLGDRLDGHVLRDDKGIGGGKIPVFHFIVHRGNGSCLLFGIGVGYAVSLFQSRHDLFCRSTFGQVLFLFQLIHLDIIRVFGILA
ncbi:hypothetical protein SDC9_176168 [bioreactor metagenome]|uniref:Uncharacterized protein n=1 Tax=bioreactor metagenome TaxID=1076179 RepID=A0A645GYM4_9ZZZZ